jgi:hypothetical protein
MSSPPAPSPSPSPPPEMTTPAQQHPQEWSDVEKEVVAVPVNTPANTSSSSSSWAGDDEVMHTITLLCTL